MNLHYRRAMEQVSLSPAARERMETEIRQACPRRRAAPRRWAAVAAAAALACAITVTANADSIREFFHTFYSDPSLAERLETVGRSCTDQGLTLTVQSATVEGDKMMAYLLVQDDGDSGVMGEYASITWNSYTVLVSKGGNYRLPDVGVGRSLDTLGYDTESSSCGFLLTLQERDDWTHPVLYGDNRFKLSVRRMIVDKTSTSFTPQIDWQALPREPESISVIPAKWWGETAHRDVAANGRLDVLAPGGEPIPAADGYEVSAMGFLEDRLHIQLRHTSKCPDDDAYLLLCTSDTEKYEFGIYPSCVIFTDEDGTEYVETIYDISPAEIGDATLSGGFLTGGKAVDGNWTVSFTLDEQEP